MLLLFFAPVRIPGKVKNLSGGIILCKKEKDYTPGTAERVFAAMLLRSFGERLH